MAKAAARGKQERVPRFVYVPRFGSHQCGGVLSRGGRRAEEPRGAARARGQGEPPPGSEPQAPATSSGARARSARSGGPSAALAGLTQKTVAKTFEFPIHFNGASKVMKNKKKISVWRKVHKVISRMLEENEKYRLRLKCQRLASEN